MNNISIFIAGAKNLKEQRLELKAMTNDLNSKYNRLKWKVSINTNSYENFGDRQEEYNDFIKVQADLVIFVIKERIGKKTEEEYILATDAYRQNGHPEIITFVHVFDERTAEIEHIEQLISRSTDLYYVDYTNTEDLLAKAKERINVFVEKRIKQRKDLKKKKGWKQILRYSIATLVVIIMCFLANVYFSPENYLIVNTLDPPSSLTKAGMGKDFIKQQIVDGVKEIGDSGNIKLEYILGELQDGIEDKSQSSKSKKNKLLQNANLREIIKSSTGNAWLGYLRKVLGKHDIRVSIRLVESEYSYICRIILDTWEGKHYVKTIESKKKNYSNSLRCALSVIKKSAAYITKAYSPIASALYDYNIIDGIEVYQMKSPWIEDLYSNSEREAMLLESSSSNYEDAPYGLLLLADFYEKGSLESSSVAMASSAIVYYNKFIKRDTSYQDIVKSKIKEIKRTLTQSKQTNNSIPDILISKGVIPENSPCRQLIVVSDEETIYANGKTYYKAMLRTYEKRLEKWKEVYTAYKVNLGIRGIAAINKKKEGDLKTPSGLYPIPFVFGYKKDIETKMDFIVVGPNHVWVCDSTSEQYNKLVVDTDGKYKNNIKNERLLRPDILNKYAITIGYNTMPIVKGKGSAIFMHVERSINHKTAGCISMPQKNIIDLIKWLNPQMNPCIYISKQI